MALDPQSLRVTAYQQWQPGNPPEPDGVRHDIWALDDQGNVCHKWYDGAIWSQWENLGHP